MNRVLVVILLGMILATILHLSNQDHERRMQMMNICSTNGGTINRAGECLPQTSTTRSQKQ
jgi:hypothetical protein